MTFFYYNLIHNLLTIQYANVKLPLIDKNQKNELKHAHMKHKKHLHPHNQYHVFFHNNKDK